MSLTVDLYDGPLLFGGIEHSASPHLLNDTWRRYLGRWVRTGTRTPATRDGGAPFVYDEAHEVSVRLGRAARGCWSRPGPATAISCARATAACSRLATADFYGSTGGMQLNRPIVRIARTPTRKGYWLVASDGGVFTFGDARFYGSTGNIHLKQPIIADRADLVGTGRWLVASDGGIFTFGDAAFLGSTGNVHLDRPIVGIATVLYGRGYLLVGADCRVFPFGYVAARPALRRTYGPARGRHRPQADDLRLLDRQPDRRHVHVRGREVRK